MFGGRPWWEILAYNNCKGMAELEFKDIIIETKLEQPLSKPVIEIPLSVKRAHSN